MAEENKSGAAAPRGRQRFTVEEIDNGYLLKISEAGSDKLVGRSAYLSKDALFEALREMLAEPPRVAATDLPGGVITRHY